MRLSSTVEVGVRKDGAVAAPVASTVSVPLYDVMFLWLKMLFTSAKNFVFSRSCRVKSVRV